jgi:hypothetical protein
MAENTSKEKAGDYRLSSRQFQATACLLLTFIPNSSGAARNHSPWLQRSDKLPRLAIAFHQPFDQLSEI